MHFGSLDNVSTLLHVQHCTMKNVILLCLHAVLTHASVGFPSSTSTFPSKAVLENLLPAEQEVIDRNAFFAGAAGDTQAAHPWPWSPTFYQSIPENITTANITAPDALPTFAVIGDFMGAIGFQWCDIERYVDHENHTLPPCGPRAGWASKVAAAYNDNIFLIDHMIRSTANADAVSLPMLFNQFDNNTSNLKLVIFAMGSKYASVTADFAPHLANMVNKVKARGIPVILMTRPPINPQPSKPQWFNLVNSTVAELIADAVRGVASETGVPCLDIWKIFVSMGQGYKDALGTDGVHYSPLGQEIVYTNLMRIINTDLREISPGQLVNTRIMRRSVEPSTAVRGTHG